METTGTAAMDDGAAARLDAAMAFERDRTAPPEGFPRFPDLATGRYIDPEFLAIEHAALWRKSWLYAGHIDQLASPGSYFLWDRAGVPVVVVRDRAGTVRAFYNSCRHRGAPLVRQDSGRVGSFVCGYHGWSYALDGTALGVRDTRDFVDLDLTCRSLVPLRCERLGGWIFVAEDPEIEPLVDYLGPVADELAEYQPDTLQLMDSRSYTVACNVKILLDAFLEVYHVQSIHQETVNRFLDHLGTAITLWPRGHSRMITPNRRPDWVDPGTRGMPVIPTVGRIARDNNVSYNIYPNLVMPPSPSGLPMLTFWPTSDRTMRIDCHWFSPALNGAAPSDLWERRIDNFERILEEDLQFAPRIQQSVEAGAVKGFPLNYQERRIYHWHEELDRRIGANRVPAALRVTPVLDRHLERAR